MRQTSLKRTKKGYVRNLGRAEFGAQPKFYLGHDRDEAIRRLGLITALWAQVEERTFRPGGSLPTWTPEELEAAKAIAKRGAAQVSPVSLSENEKDFVKYVHDVGRISDVTGVKFTPSRAKAYAIGMNVINRRFSEAHQGLSRAVAKDVPLPTGQTLNQPLDAYRAYIDREYWDAEGTISDNGKTKQIQIKAIKCYLPDVDLAALDY